MPLRGVSPPSGLGYNQKSSTSCGRAERSRSPSVKQPFIISSETRKRCRVQPATIEALDHFATVNLEHYHLLYGSPLLDFSLYLRNGQEILEFMQTHEFSRSILDQLAETMRGYYDNTDILVHKGDLARLERCLNVVRRGYYKQALEAHPSLKSKIAPLLASLGEISQGIVGGGISEGLVTNATITAQRLVANLGDPADAILKATKLVQLAPVLYDHAALVAVVAPAIATLPQAPSIEIKDLADLALSGLFHDIGRTVMPTAIVRLPTRDYPTEYEEPKTHTTDGFDVLCNAINQGVMLPETIAQVVLEHHERFGGGGYPRGRQGRAEDDPLDGIQTFVRIVGIADTYVSLIMPRPGQPSLSPQGALATMRQSETDFDPDYFRPFQKMIQAKAAALFSATNDGSKGASKGKILIIDEGRVAKIQK